jgi:hypothetical protein
MEKFKMDRNRLQKLAGIITENYDTELEQNILAKEDVNSDGVPLNKASNIMNRRVKYVGKLFEFDPLSDTSIKKITNDPGYGESYMFDSLQDFLTIVRHGLDWPESEVEKYINSLRFKPLNGAIVSRYRGMPRKPNAKKLHNQYLELKLMKTKTANI